MNYQVLARKWRPSNFTEVVGQEHVVKSLANALQHNRLHHAYLFTGTRGVGKTTLARILAKAINCENLQNVNPCGVCRVCRALDEGRFLDLIEVDAASRTKVEDTRDLLDNAQYAPNQGRYKVYLIDEVHMLSGHSFNALLKTLEEPPPHVKFLLATTDPHKIPVTVLSRCLQFNLKHLSPAQILSQMQFILGQEAIEFEMAALKLLARAADGSMRDGLSLLDQAIVFGSGDVNVIDVRAMLGTVAEPPIDAILTALANGDASTLLNKISEIASLTTDFNDVLQQMLRVLHRIAMEQQVLGSVEDESDAEIIAELTTKISPEDVQLYYQIALMGQRDLDLAPDPRRGFEMIMLRMLTFRPAAVIPAPVKPSSAPTENTKKPHLPAVSRSISTLPESPPNAPVVEKSADRWVQMIAAMKIGGMTRELANNCVLQSLDDKVCVLTLDSAYKHLRGSVPEEKLQKALQIYCSTPLKLIFQAEKVTVDTPAIQLTKQREDQQQSAVDAINTDGNVLAIKEQFAARILGGTIETV
jgi:DNA polymerase-3 subunit gamma/tau